MRRIEGFICAGLLVVFVLAVVLSFQDGETSLDAAAHPGLASDRSFGSAPLVPLLPGPALPPDKVALGERLFHDTRLSHDDTVSCATCHSLSSGGVDQLPVSIGINGAEGGINAPTVFNSALSFVQFWDGRAATLVDQASGPVHNPIEMGSNWPEVLAKLGADVSYVEAFEQIYPDGLTAEAIVDAIVTFERSLITPNSPFDRYLNGERHALSLLERRGYRLFTDYGCASCHQGVAVGGNLFQRFGVVGDYFAGRQPTEADLGRFNVTGLAEDRHVFKVPSLRNVALTAPYFHDGSTKSLEDAVSIMGRFQLGRELSDQEIGAITAFLHSLTGTWNGEVLE